MKFCREIPLAYNAMSVTRRLPTDADLYQNKLWMDRVFPQNSSSESPVSNGFLQSVIITGKNVLSADGIKKMSRLHNRIVNHIPDYGNYGCLQLRDNNAWSVVIFTAGSYSYARFLTTFCICRSTLYFDGRSERVRELQYFTIVGL